MGTLLAPLQYGALGLDSYRENARGLLLEKARDTRKSTSGPDTGDKSIDPALHLLPEFVGSGGMVEVGIGGVFELESGKGPRGFGRHGPAAADGSGHGLCLRRADNRGPKAAHENALFFGKAFGHKENHLVAAMHAHQGEPHPGIAGGCLDDSPAWLQQAAPFGIQDHAQRCPILNAAAGIE